MSNEIKKILNYLRNDDYSPVFADEGCDDTPYKLFDETEVKLLLDYITNLQKEKDTSDDYARHLHNENKKLQENYERLYNENERLKELCDKYEEEHSTIFQKWLKELKGGNE